MERKKEALKEAFKYVKIYNLVPVLICFMLGRARLFDFFSPLAFSASACFGTGLGAVCAFASLLGMISRGLELYTYKYFFIFGAFLFIDPVITKKFPEKDFSVGLTPLVATLLGGSLFGVFYGFSAYYLFLNTVEAVFAFFITYIFDRGFAMTDPLRPKKLITSEEVISLIVIFCGVICGVMGESFMGVDIAAALITLFMLCVCYKFGSAAGACCGSISAFLFSLQGEVMMEYFPVLSLGGFFGGFLKGRNRGFTASIFTVAVFLLCLGFDKSLLSKSLILGEITGATVFLFLPDRLYYRLSSVFATGIREPEEYIEQVYSMVENTLKSYSFSFRSLGAAFTELKESEDQAAVGSLRIERMLDETVYRMCGTCSLRDFCWDKNYYATYEAVCEMFMELDREGYIDITSSDYYAFKRSCMAVTSFIQMAERVWEKDRCESLWKGRLAAAGAVMKCYLESVAELLFNLSLSFRSDLSFDKKLSLRLSERLKKERIGIKNLSAGKTSGGRPEILVTLRNCDCTKQNTDRIIEAIDEEYGERVMKDSGIAVYDRYNKDLCTIRFIGENRLRVGVKILREPKGGGSVSGDNHTFSKLKDGTYLLALSDGMGSGEPAREESAASLDLFRDFISAGFSKEASVRLINTCLEFTGPEDSFATMDACIINLYSGDASFIKTGACPSYVLRNGKVDVIDGSGLPVGIVGDIKPEIREYRLKKNDTLIMVTDGVTESFNTKRGRENDLQKLIENNSDLTYPGLCESIFEAVRDNYMGRMSDDATVMVARIY